MNKVDKQKKSARQVWGSKDCGLLIQFHVDIAKQSLQEQQVEVQDHWFPQCRSGAIFFFLSCNFQDSTVEIFKVSPPHPRGPVFFHLTFGRPDDEAGTFRVSAFRSLETKKEPKKREESPTPAKSQQEVEKKVTCQDGLKKLVKFF